MVAASVPEIFTEVSFAPSRSEVLAPRWREDFALTTLLRRQEGLEEVPCDARQPRSIDVRVQGVASALHRAQADLNVRTFAIRMRETGRSARRRARRRCRAALLDLRPRAQAVARA